MRRVRSLTRFLPVAVAALAVVVLIPADETTRQATMQSAALSNSVAAVQLLETGDVQATATTSPVSSQTPAAAGTQSAVAALPPAVWGATLTTVTPPLAEEVTATRSKSVRVGDTAVNVRAGPSTATAKLFVLQPGDGVTITETSGRWASIVSSSGETGWVYARYLSNGTSAAEADPPGIVASTSDDNERKPALRFGRVGAPVLVRAGPSRSSPRLFVLGPGERIAVAESRGRWVRVVMESGVSGWVSTRELPR